MSGLSWFYESANNINRNELGPATTFGALTAVSENGVDQVRSFDERFEDLCSKYKGNLGIDIKKDFQSMINDDNFMETYKTDLLQPVIEAYEAMSPNDPHVAAVAKEVTKFWDNKIKQFSESAAITQYLPMTTLEFPVLVKQAFSSILKDIIEVESVKSPNISKHIRTTYLVDNNTGEEYEYPKCMFDGTWEKIWNAAKGHKIKEDIVPFVDGRLWKYDIITGLTDGTPGIDQLSIQFKIVKVQVGTEIIPIPGNGITIEFSTGGTLLNGDLDFEYNGTHVEDTLGGQVNFRKGIISISSSSGQVTGVGFEGYLSNEKNLRSVSVREKRDIIRYTIEDGPRWNMPFTIEQIEDAAALLDINYYNRMVDEITKTQEMEECMTVIKFLLDEQAKFNDVQTDIWKLESTARTFYVDLDPQSMVPNFAGDPIQFMTNVTQFRLSAAIHQLEEMTKLEDLSFIIVGNPLATNIIEPFISWKQTSGTTIGGIKTNGTYGFATNLGANIRVVASNLYDAYTVDPDPETGKRELVLHVYAYPTAEDHVSFRHLRYSSHLMSHPGSAYGSTQAPAGAYQVVTATSRFKTFSVQGISCDLILRNSDRIYGEAPVRPPVMGAPWQAA